MKFKTGDRVVLSPDSEYAEVGSQNPLGVVGVVYEINPPSREILPIWVEWDSVRDNQYSDKDLRLVGIQGGYEFPTWLEMKRPSEGQSGLVVGHLQTDSKNPPVCWLITDRAERKIWTCNAAFRKITPAEAAMMLLALQELEDERSEE